MPRFQRWCTNVSKKERILKRSINMMRWSEVSMDRLDKLIDHLKDVRDVKMTNQLRAQLKRRGERPQFSRKRYPTLEYTSSEYESESYDNDRSDLSAPTSSSQQATDPTIIEDDVGISPPAGSPVSITLVDTDVPSGTAPPSLLNSPTFPSDESPNNSDYSARVNPYFPGPGVPWIVVRSDSSSSYDSACKRCRLEHPLDGVEYPQPRVENPSPDTPELTEEVPVLAPELTEEVLPDSIR